MLQLLTNLLFRIDGIPKLYCLRLALSSLNSKNFCTSPFLFIKNKRLFIVSEGFSTLEKNALICYQRAMLPLHWPSADRNGSWRPFCLNSNFLGRVWQPSAEYNGVPKGHYYLQRAVIPYEITQQNTVVCRGQERPTVRKGTLMPDFQANTRPRIFFKKAISPQDTGRQLWGNPGIPS
jgi:hypothetical protein